MSERRSDAEISQKQCFAKENCSLIDEDEIINVSVFDFDDIDAWLFVPTQCPSESTIHDIYTWLRSEPEVVLSGNKKYVDTRTFTRPKKRSSRASFDCIFEAMSPSVQNVWKTPCSNFTNIEETISKSPNVSLVKKDESVPSMLKMGPTATAQLLSDEIAPTSGHESMEVFLNMSHSKGIDSFINLTEPGLSDPLMNVSQPSIFYSSIMSLCRDDSLHNADSDEAEKSVTLNHTLSIKPEESSSNGINETFSRHATHVNNESYLVSPANQTFVNKSETFDRMDLNETYNADAASRTLTLSSSDKDKSRTSVSSMFVHTDDNNVKPVHSQSSEKKDLALDATYLSHETEKNSAHLDATYLSLETETKSKDITINVHKEHNQSRRSINNISMHTIDTTMPIANSPFSSSLENLNSTYKFPNNKHSTPKMEMNSTFKAIPKSVDQRIYNAGLCSNLKAPMSLRRELLTEIHRSEERKLDSTYNHIGDHLEQNRKDNIDGTDHRGDIPVENKYNTYKKESPTDRIRHQAESKNTACGQESQDRKYYTFTKKGIAHGKTDMENAGSLENVDTTFVKPFPKLPKRKVQNGPRMFTKLPQFLQKSNPNLVLNKNLVSKLNTDTGDFQLMGAGGSTESIESTQSAHSAPDLDDRLSTCSDCSHNSYTTQTMNIEQLHQIVRMQEESLEHDATPKLNRRVLENTWIEGKEDLPSPILKNGIEGCEYASPTAMSIDCNVKTSSPMISPIGSSQSINTDGNPMENIPRHHNETILKKVEVANKPVKKVENRTRLRPPTNWNTGSRPANVTSAIPRPTSRIPAPRFARPAAKTQVDAKRGYM